MKKILFTFIIIGCTFILSAQQDSKAKEILDKLSSLTKSHKVIQTNFEIEYKNINDNTQNSSKGSITMMGEKYRLNFMGTESFFDGKILWNYIPEVKEVNISEPEPDDEDIFSNPRKLFTIYESDYKYQFIDNITEKGVNYSIVDLYPNNIDEEYSRIRLTINIDDYFLSSATIFGKEGSHYIISINSYKTNFNFDDSYFTFNKSKYPDVEVIDMRW